MPHHTPSDTSTPDISKTEFAHALRLHSLGWLPGVDRFVDLQHPHARRYILPVKDARGRLLREASIHSCLAARAAYEAELAEQLAEAERKAALAGLLAVSALPPPRADLDGPAAVSQLADDFIVQATRNDGVVYRDLIRMGWTGAQLKQHVEAARIVAQRRQERALDPQQLEAV